MDIPAFLNDLSSKGITVRVDGGKLSVTSAKGRQAVQAFILQLQQYKQDIIEHLSGKHITTGTVRIEEAPDQYRHEIRMMWEYGIRRLSRCFQKYDGLTEAEARTVAKDVLTLLCNDSIRACKKGGSQSVAYVLEQAIQEATRDTLTGEQ